MSSWKPTVAFVLVGGIALVGGCQGLQPAQTKVLSPTGWDYFSTREGNLGQLEYQVVTVTAPDGTITETVTFKLGDVTTEASDVNETLAPMWQAQLELEKARAESFNALLVNVLERLPTP